MAAKNRQPPHSDIDKTREEVLGAFNELKPIPITDQETYLPIDFHEFMIQSFTEDLLDYLGPVTVLPAAAETKKQLAQIKKCAHQLLFSLYRLHGPAIDALNFRKPTIGELQRLLERFYEAASLAKPTPIPKGRRPLSREREIANLAANQYSRITGKAPTRTTYAKARRGDRAILGGEFVTFLKKIFTAFGLRPSVDRYARVAIVEWTKLHPGQTK